MIGFEIHFCRNHYFEAWISRKEHLLLSLSHNNNLDLVGIL